MSFAQNDSKPDSCERAKFANLYANYSIHYNWENNLALIYLLKSDLRIGPAITFWCLFNRGEGVLFWDTQYLLEQKTEINLFEMSFCSKKLVDLFHYI